jgi:hypothetical protein
MAALSLASSVLAATCMRARVTLTLVAALFVLRSPPALAAEGDGAAHVDAGVDGPDDGAGGQAAPLACDGALCDTTNGAECSVPRGAIGGAPFGAHAIALLSLTVACVARRARRGATRPARGARAC